MPFKNLEELAEYFESMDNSSNSEFGFDMNFEWSSRESSMHPCGSAACIGGTIQMFNHETRGLTLIGAVQSISPGTSLKQAKKLCFPPTGHQAWHASPMQACAAILMLDREGVVDWDRVIRENA